MTSKKLTKNPSSGQGWLQFQHSGGCRRHSAHVDSLGSIHAGNGTQVYTCMCCSVPISANDQTTSNLPPFYHQSSIPRTTRRASFWILSLHISCSKVAQRSDRPWTSMVFAPRLLGGDYATNKADSYAIKRFDFWNLRGITSHKRNLKYSCMASCLVARLERYVEQCDKQTWTNHLPYVS